MFVLRGRESISGLSYCPLFRQLPRRRRSTTTTDAAAAPDEPAAMAPGCNPGMLKARITETTTLARAATIIADFTFDTSRGLFPQ
jgi:hypothetical protein